MDASLYRVSPGKGPALRVGLVLDTMMLPAWSAEIVDHLLVSEFVTLDVVLLCGRNPEAREGAPPGLLRVYQRWDRRHVEPDRDPLSPVDLTARLAGVEKVAIAMPSQKGSRRIPRRATERIAARTLDVLVRLGNDDVALDSNSSVRYGVWSLVHGEEAYAGALPYFSEMMRRSPVCRARLRVTGGGEDCTEQILYEGLFASDEGFSHWRNGLQPYWGSTIFVIQKLRDLHVRGWEQVLRDGAAPSSGTGAKGACSFPSNRELVSWLVPLLGGKAALRLTHRRAVRHWRLAIRTGGPLLLDEPDPPNMGAFRWIDSPRGRFFADPFIVEEGGRLWVFFEDLDYSTDVGRISCAEVRDGTIGEAIPALTRSYHLSYPCLIREADAWYMIPESATAGAVQLFRCLRFPDHWQHEKDLYKGNARDTTVVVENGTYWFFITVVEPRGSATQLWLFSSPSLRGEWTSHPCNPISTDVRFARCGGAIFRHRGRLYRPSQDGSGEYGRNLILNEIVALDHDRYREEPRLTVKPDWMRGLSGTHTYGCAGSTEVIDGKTRLAASRVL